MSVTGHRSGLLLMVTQCGWDRDTNLATETQIAGTSYLVDMALDNGNKERERERARMKYGAGSLLLFWLDILCEMQPIRWRVRDLNMDPYICGIV